jgi:Response regulator containing CheY-like receiver, AAA-type ATPase, and DNA-binding domains
MSIKVLIVDDSASMRQQLKFTLQKNADFDVLEAEDGRDALDKVNANADIKVIISDVNMPEMNGIEFLEAMHEKGLSIPTVMLTTTGEVSLITRAKAAGAKGWMVKPFDPQKIVKVIRTLAG